MERGPSTGPPGPQRPQRKQSGNYFSSLRMNPSAGPGRPAPVLRSSLDGRLSGGTVKMYLRAVLRSNSHCLPASLIGTIPPDKSGDLKQIRVLAGVATSWNKLAKSDQQVSRSWDSWTGTELIYEKQ